MEIRIDSYLRTDAALPGPPAPLQALLVILRVVEALLGKEVQNSGLADRSVDSVQFEFSKKGNFFLILLVTVRVEQGFVDHETGDLRKTVTLNRTRSFVFGRGSFTPDFKCVLEWLESTLLQLRSEKVSA